MEIMPYMLFKQNKRSWRQGKFISCPIISFFMDNKSILVLRIFSLPFLVLIIHIVMDFYGIYVKYEWLDIPMHLIGGFVISRSYYLFLRIIQSNGNLGFIHSGVLFIIVISLIALTSLMWELYEFIFDFIDNGTRQTNNLDTMTDMSLGLIGGIFSYLYFKITNTRL